MIPLIMDIMLSDKLVDKNIAPATTNIKKPIQAKITETGVKCVCRTSIGSLKNS